MLKLLLCRTGVQLSGVLLRRACERAAKGRRQLFLVPEQFSHEMERRLCAAGGNGICVHAEVLSFTRLFNRVFAQTGGLAERTLDPGGRVLAMKTALSMVSDQLSLYNRPSGKAAFIQGLLATFDELKRCCIPPEALLQAGMSAGGKQGEKLRELSLIFGAYDAVTAKIASDPRDRLDRLAERLREIPFAQGTDFWIDGFTDFTAQEERVLQQLMKQASSVTAGLVCDRAEADDGPGIFSTVRKTAESLLQMARRQGISAETEFLPDSGAASPALNHLRRHLLSGPPVPFSSDFREIELFEAETPFSEVEYAAARILRLVREEGCRFRDIAVAAPDFEEYAPAIEHIFARYGVPVFFSRRTDILKKPVPALILSALAVRTENYTYEAVFRYLKTGLTGIPAEDCSLLENYVLKWDIRGASWAREADWTMHPRGYNLPWEEEDKALLSRLNILRRNLCAPLRLLGGSGETVRAHATALFRFLEEIDLPQRLSERTRQLAAAGEQQLAQEYGQLWDILCDALDQCVDILGDTPMDLSSFADLFSLLLTQYDVGSIPASLDQVSAGEPSRVCFRPMKHLLLLGATDTAIPRIVTPPGLLSEEDRALLAGMGLPMKLQSEEQIFRELWTIRNACTAPESGLFISRPAGSADGTVLRPSLLQAQLQKLFPGLTPKRERELDGSYRTASPLPALEWAARRIFAGADDGGVLDALAGRPEYAAAANSIRAALAGRRGALSPQASDRLYGKNVQFSASRLDQYKSCHFAYFMRYGLKAKPRSPASLDAPQIGTFIHFVLENVLRDAAKGAGIRETSDELYCALTDEYIRRYAEEQLGGLDNQSARFRYLYKRLHKTVHAMVSNSVTELRASAFTPISFELGFGANGDLPPVTFTADGVTVSISGFVDRVDGYVKDDKLFLRVVDYKTGEKPFDLTDIWHGLGLQMLLYLFTLGEKGSALYQREIIPAGVLYLPARDFIVRGGRDMTQEELRRSADRELRRKGLVLDDPDIIGAMESPGEGGFRFLPVHISEKTGRISGEALVSAAQLGKLHRHVNTILRDICRELGKGNISADPWYKNERQSACAFCDFRDACHFDESTGEDKRRYLYPVKHTEFWENV